MNKKRKLTNEEIAEANKPFNKMLEEIELERELFNMDGKQHLYRKIRKYGIIAYIIEPVEGEQL